MQREWSMDLKEDFQQRCILQITRFQISSEAKCFCVHGQKQIDRSFLLEQYLLFYCIRFIPEIVKYY